MFDDIDNIEDIEVSENDLGASESEDSVTAVESSCTQEDYNLLESSSNLLELDYDSINTAESFLHHYGGSLTIDEVNESIQSASDFFNMDSPMIVSEGWTTGVFNRNLTTVNDDVLIFNPDQLQSMGITEKEGHDLVMTHENTHSALQGSNTGFSEHQEELCCDYMSGVRAGLNSMNTEQMVNSLAETPETITHPVGELRVEAIQEGQEFASNFLAEHGHAPTFDDCLEHFKSSEAFSQTLDPLTLVPNTGNGSEEFHGYTQADVEWYEHQARISSGSEQAHWLKEAKWARDHIHGFASTDDVMDEEHSGEIHQFHRGQYGNATGDYIDDSYPMNEELGEIKGIFIDNRAVQLKYAQEAKENAEWHEKRSKDAISRGDLTAARDHADRAALYRKQERDAIAASKKCTK